MKMSIQEYWHFDIKRIKVGNKLAKYIVKPLLLGDNNLLQKAPILIQVRAEALILLCGLSFLTIPWSVRNPYAVLELTLGDSTLLLYE